MKLSFNNSLSYSKSIEGYTHNLGEAAAIVDEEQILPEVPDAVRGARSHQVLVVRTVRDQGHQEGEQYDHDGDGEDAQKSREDEPVQGDVRLPNRIVPAEHAEEAAVGGGHGVGKGERRVSEKVGKGERKVSEKVGKRMEREVNKRKHPSSCDSRTSLVSLTRRRTAGRRTGRFDPVGSGTFRHAGIVIWLRVVGEEAKRWSKRRVGRESE